MRRIEPLAPNHDRSGFDCGVSALNRYLRETARQHADKGISRSFVLTDASAPDKILGFFTLSVCEIQAERLPSRIARKYPRTIPAARLARLAIAKNRQREGLGRLLMVDAMLRCLAAAESVGIVALFVDARDEAAARYYAQYGFIPLPDQTLTLCLPLKTLRESLK
ncbi:MAG: GNAT family N-acetyltransferase [Gammaproteobacteria bacterium]|nr:GNAT family N-acetyltransferase [Gammaproteobacteria bacterium]